MIIPGTKIVVLASNGTRRGPNTGSIGYVSYVIWSGKAPRSITNHLKSYEIIPQKGKRRICELFCIYRLAVVFERLGWHGKPRVEQHHIDVLVPSIPLITEKQIKLFLKAITTCKTYPQLTTIIDLDTTPYKLESSSHTSLIPKLYSVRNYIRNHALTHTCNSNRDYKKDLTSIIHSAHRLSFSKREWKHIKSLVRTKGNKNSKVCIDFLDTATLQKIITSSNQVMTNLLRYDFIKQLSAVKLGDVLYMSSQQLCHKLIAVGIWNMFVYKPTTIKEITEMRYLLKSLSTS